MDWRKKKERKKAEGVGCGPETICYRISVSQCLEKCLRVSRYERKLHINALGLIIIQINPCTVLITSHYIHSYSQHIHINY